MSKTLDQRLNKLICGGTHDHSKILKIMQYGSTVFGEFDLAVCNIGPTQWKQLGSHIS